MNTNAIPRSIKPLVTQAEFALAGAISKGAALPLDQNDAVKIAADLHSLIGAGPADPLRGSNGALGRAISLHAAARKNYQSALAAGREFCRAAVSVLRVRLASNSWNQQWEAAGFTGGSLAIPDEPLNLLHSLSEYFLLNPAHESADLEVTSNRAHALAEGLQAAAGAVNARKAEELIARQVRDAGITQLRRRLGNLREELSLLMAADDARWYDFGFNRPVDGRLPDRVEELMMEGARPGEVLVLWETVARAENYRVQRQITDVDAKPVFVGIYTDPQAILQDLPSGAPVKVMVSARNEAGESKAAEGVILVP